MKIQAKLIFVLFCISNLLAGQKSGFVNSGTFIDPRDSHTYKTVKIASQIWMAENLAYKAEQGCWAYNDEMSNVNKYGYLYSWETAKKICPDGWKLPTDSEWAELINYLGGNGEAGGKLKETGTTNWKSPNEGANNESGFSALPAGDRVFYGPFTFMGELTRFWTATGRDIWRAFYCYLSFDKKDVTKEFADVRYGISVRCLLEPEKQKNLSYDYLNPVVLRQKIGKYYDASLPGQEELKYGNGIYKGQVLNGIPNGKGRFLFSTGDIYEGDFVNDVQQGKGKFIFRNGDIYSGEFFKDEMSGNGIYISGTGSIYDGEWKGNKYNGKGILRFAGGEIYDGEFVRGELNGFGKYTDLIGNISEGLWQNGKLVSPKQNTISNEEEVGANSGNNRFENNSSATQIDGLVAFYPFNGNANDESGNGNSGFVSGAILTNDRFGNKNSAYLFDGSNDYIRIPHSNKLNFQNFTISLWIKVKGEGSPAKEHWGLICKNNSDSGYQDQFSLFINRTSFGDHPPYSVMGRIGDGSLGYANTYSSKIVNDDKWHQVIFVLDNNLDKVDLLVDNVLVATDKFKSNLINNSDPINIGYWAGYNNFFNGCIDDIMIFNKALNENEITSLFTRKNENFQKNNVITELPDNTTNQNQRHTLEDGSVFEGDLVNGKMEGKGRYIFNNGILYAGDFKNNQLEGNGKFIYPSGLIYEGEIVRGKRQGKGVMFYKNGKTMFDGDWLNDKLDGLGKYYDENGKLICEGEWKDNKLDGKGKTYHENGESYEGDFQSGKMSGYGKYYYPDGDTYIGIFINDKPDGRGRFVYANGDLHEGQWKDGKFVEISQTSNINKLKEKDDLEQSYPNLAKFGTFLNQAYNSTSNNQGNDRYEQNSSDYNRNNKKEQYKSESNSENSTSFEDTRKTNSNAKSSTQSQVNKTSKSNSFLKPLESERRTLIGRCEFSYTNNSPKYTTSFGSMTVYHNGDFKKKYIEGKYDCYAGSGTIWIIFNTSQVASTFKFVGNGSVQTCQNY